MTDEPEIPEMRCPDCEGPLLEREVFTFLEYGVEGSPLAARLPVIQPVLYCPAGCPEQWSDWRGEEAREAAVQKHLRDRSRSTE